MTTIAITHPKHGKAHCHRDQLPGMAAHGWSEDKPKEKNDTGTGTAPDGTDPKAGK